MIAIQKTQVTQERSPGCVNPWDLPTAELLPDSIPDGNVRHVVALFNPLTINERLLIILTSTSSYVDVHREIDRQKAVHNLFGYEVRAVLESPCGF